MITFWRPVRRTACASFVEKSFRKSGIDLERQGEGVEERVSMLLVGVSSSKSIGAVSEPTEADLLIGDPTNANEKLGWRHESKLDDLIAEMIREDLKVMARSVPPAHANKEFAHA
jgi:GDPmannose 4,6-dehydratase